VAFTNPLAPDSLTLTQAAALTGRSSATITRWIKAGDLAAGKMGGRWYTTEAAIEQFNRAGTPGDARQAPPPPLYPSPAQCQAIISAALPPMKKKDTE
jgi:excisionase family DNA binding protein